MKWIKPSFKNRFSPPKAGGEMTGLPEVLGSRVDVHQLAAMYAEALRTGARP